MAHLPDLGLDGNGVKSWIDGHNVSQLWQELAVAGAEPQQCSNINTHHYREILCDSTSGVLTGCAG